MRVWDIPVSKLCRQHLLGQHRELHAIHSILTNGKKGYRHHPEVKRWENNLSALKFAHDSTAGIMFKRGYKHDSPLSPCGDMMDYPKPWEPIEVQWEKLRAKDCPCLQGGNDGRE